MPRLILLDGDEQRSLELTDGEVLLGRHPDCDVQLESNMVSRRHARVYRDGIGWVVEDLGSGNGTFVNGKKIEQPARLSEGARLKFGPILVRYEATAGGGSSRNLVPDTSETADELSGIVGGVTITGGAGDDAQITGSAPSESGFGLLNVRPEQKLAAVIEISRQLAGSTDVEDLLPRVLDTLFDIFPAADRGVVLLRGGEGGRLVPATQKHRRAGDDETVKMSRTVLEKVVNEKSGILSSDATGDSQFNASESIAQLEIRSMMAVPLLSLDGEVVGVIHLDTQNPMSRFTAEDLDLLMAVAGQAALSWESHRLAISAAEKRKQDGELAIARNVQRTLLPEVLPEAEGYDFFASYDAAQAVGGDYYDAMTLSDGKVCLAFGDVAGKGVPGALLMSRISSCVQSVMQYETDVTPAFESINDHMCSRMAEGRFVTFVLVTIDPASHEMTLVNGGHMSPQIRSAAGEIDEFPDDTIGVPVGVMQGYPYDTVRRVLEPGDTVLIVTDGVDEAMNPAGDLYGKERVREFLKSGPQRADELGRSLLQSVREHAAGRPQNDDIAIMTFGRRA